MSRELKGSNGAAFTPTPKVLLSEKVGNSFTGILKAVRDTKYGPMHIFGIISSDAPIKVKDENGIWNDIDVNEGDAVVLPGAKQLKDKFEEAEIGDTLTVVFKCKVLNPKSGQNYEDYKVTLD